MTNCVDTILFELCISDAKYGHVEYYIEHVESGEMSKLGLHGHVLDSINNFDKWFYKKRDVEGKKLLPFFYCEKEDPKLEWIEEHPREDCWTLKIIYQHSSDEHTLDTKLESIVVNDSNKSFRQFFTLVRRWFRSL